MCVSQNVAEKMANCPELHATYLTLSHPKTKEDFYPLEAWNTWERFNEFKANKELTIGEVQEAYKEAWKAIDAWFDFDPQSASWLWKECFRLGVREGWLKGF